MASRLTIIPTPIGNIEDITLRALRMLREADVVLAEDTRTSAKLLQEYGIKVTLMSHHKFNEHQVTDHLVALLSQGHRICLISDAGTPGISDPGFYLVRSCILAGIEVECLPGPTALIPAIVASGLPCDRFVFEGFLPAKKGRRTRVAQMADRDITTILYESPRRVIDLLTLLSEELGSDRPVVVARELSKKFEEYIRGSLSDVLLHCIETPPKGEVVLLVSGREKNEKIHQNKYKVSSPEERPQKVNQ